MKPNRDLIVLTIETLTDHVFEVIVHRQALVSDLKLKIKYMYGIEMQNQHLLSGSIELEDTQTLEHYRLKNGSTVKLVTALKGGPISYHTTPQPPPFLSLATFLLSSSEPDDSGQKDSDGKNMKKNHSFYIVHNGCLLKIREFVNDNAEDMAKEYIRKLSIENINEDELAEALSKERFEENKKLKKKMREVRKNIDENNSILREKLERKRMTRPELPGVPLISGYDVDKVPASSHEIKEMLRIKRAKKKLSQEKIKIQKLKENNIFDDEDYESAVTVDTDRPSEDDFGRIWTKKFINKKLKKENKKSEELRQIEQKKKLNALQVKPAILSERPNKTIKKISMETEDSSVFHGTTTVTPKSSKQINFKEANKQRHASNVLPEFQNIFKRPDVFSSAEDSPLHGVLSPSYERFINNEELIHEVKSLEAIERKREIVTPELESRRSEQVDKEESQKNMAGIEYDSFLTLMTLIGNTKRSFERTSSNQHKLGLTPRRFTHDGRTNESINSKVLPEPPITTKKMNLLTRPDSKNREPQKISGMVVINRCAVCNKKLGIAVGYKCKCNKHFCATHKFPEEHECTFDYKKEARKKLKKDNPVVIASKIKKL